MSTRTAATLPQQTTVGPPRSGVAGTGTAAAAVTAGTNRYLTFLLGGELYALPILDVVEILEYRPLTTVPMMPAFIRGVLNLRGSVVPVVDLATHFQRAGTEIARRTSIIIVDTAHDGTGRRMGILVDAVNKVLHLTGGDIEPPPQLGAATRSDLISGMAKYDDQFIVILDLAHLLTAEHLNQLDPHVTASDDFPPPAAGRTDLPEGHALPDQCDKAGEAAEADEAAEPTG